LLEVIDSLSTVFFGGLGEIEEIEAGLVSNAKRIYIFKSSLDWHCFYVDGVATATDSRDCSVPRKPLAAEAWYEDHLGG
jgi:hypothetical protein